VLSRQGKKGNRPAGWIQQPVMSVQVRGLEYAVRPLLGSSTRHCDLVLAHLKGHDEVANELALRIADNIPTIYEVVTGGNNVPEGDGRCQSADTVSGDEA
jgi:hypothetical protein